MRRNKSSSRDVPPLICSDARDRPFGTLWCPFASTGYRLRPRVTLGERSVCRYHPEAGVIVGGRWVPADGSNSRKPSPLLERAWPRSGDKAGCNPEVAADIPLV